MTRATSLKDFALTVTTEFNASQELVSRFGFAKRIAEDYGFDCPELVLTLTHPQISKLSFIDKCQKLGLTEEQYVRLASQKGFRQFAEEYRKSLLYDIQSQSLVKLAEAVAEDRYKVDGDGNETSEKDLDIERQLISPLIATERANAAPNNINVSFNLWDQAREKARLDSASVIDVSPTSDNASSGTPQLMGYAKR